MGAREAGGSRFCAVVRCVSCVQSSDMLAEPPNTDATRPWPRGEAGLHRLVGSGSSPLEAKDVCVVGEVRVKAAVTCFAVQGGKRRTDEEKERQHGDEEAHKATSIYPHTWTQKWRLHMWSIRVPCAPRRGRGRARTDARIDRSSSSKPSYCHPGPAPLFWLPSEGMPAGAWA